VGKYAVLVIIIYHNECNNPHSSQLIISIIAMVIRSRIATLCRLIAEAEMAFNMYECNTLHLTSHLPDTQQNLSAYQCVY